MQPSDPNYWNPGDETAPDAPAEAVETSEAEPAPLSIDWEASEHLQHNNGTGWYIAFFLIAAILIAFAILFHAWTFIPVVLVMVVAGIIYVRRPPRTLHYSLTDSGLVIEGVVHLYTTFKSFSVIRDGAFFAVLLIPVRRFAPSITVYFAEADGEAIVDTFGSHLPMENRELDALERFLRLIRF